MARTSKKTSGSKKTDELVRLNKYISQCGIASRRAADGLIEEGLIRVNSSIITELGFKIDPTKDSVFYKGKKINPTQNFIYMAVYKPRNVLTTLSDPHDRPTITDLIPKKYKKEKLFPVGRLDWQSEGLLILTNDGDYAQEVLHPKKNVPKTYEVKVEGKFLQKDADKLLKGVTIPGGKASAVKVDIIKKSTQSTHSWVRITVTEGRNRLIRKMMEKLGFGVMRLRRVSIGNLKVSHLKAGDVALLSEEARNKVFDLPANLKNLI